MYNDDLDIFEKIMKVCFSVIFIIIIYVMSYIPFMMIAESECLEKGYPNSTIDYKYNSYCVKTFGDITEVVKLK